MSTTTKPAERRSAASLSGRRVLVTGAAGFIGTALCRTLAHSGAEVHGTSRSRREPTSEVRWWTVDLSDQQTAAQIFRAVEPELVVHLASHVNGDRSLAAVHPTFRDNLCTTVNVLTAASTTSRPRVILAGSMEEPGADEIGIPPSSPYAAAKSAASIYAELFHTLYDLPVVRLRVFMVYGPGQRDTRKLVPYVTTSLLRGDRPRLSAGTRKIDWVYVADVVDAVLAAAAADDVAGECLDVGSGHLVSVRTVVEKIARFFGDAARPMFGVRTDRPFEHERVSDPTRTYQFIGWRPTTSLDEGLKQTVQWYSDHHRFLEDV